MLLVTCSLFTDIMIGALKGKVIFQGPNYVILAVNDVGYKVYVVATGDYKLGETLSLHTHQVIGEQVSDLYGFKQFGELEFFEQLLQVGGVGPKIALAICSQPIDKIKKSIISSDPSQLQLATGVGGKLASKIVLELRPKFASGQADLANLSADDNELVQALSKFGWRRQEVAQVVSEVSGSTLNERLKHALKLLGS